MNTGEKFNNSIEEYVKKLISGNTYSAPINSFLDEEVYSSDFLFFIFSTCPEIVFSKVKIDSKMKDLKNQVEIWNPNDKKYVLNELAGVLSCHALSPSGDSIFLLADLGRALRTAVAIRKPFHIMLADKNWSKYNWVAKDIGSDNLLRNQIWREELYKMLGANMKECNLSNTPNGLKERDIENLGISYEDLVKSIFGSKYLGRKLDTDERKKLREQFKLYSSASDKIDFLSISLIKEKLKPEKEVIFNLLQTLLLPFRPLS